MTNPKNINSEKISTDFKIIPNTIEKPTNPFLYSFFNGLKNVLTRRKIERI